MSAAANTGKVRDSFPYWLRPAAPADLVRVGSGGDGGYVLPRRVIDEVRGVLGMGLFDDWSFEEWIYERTGAKVAIFDHTVTWRFWLRRTAAHFVRGVLQGNSARRKKLTIPIAYWRFFSGAERRHFQIGIGNSPGMIGLEQAMILAGMTENILLKVDIEGAEYEILDAIVVNRNRLVACVIEFHLIDQHIGALKKFIAEMGGDLALVHFHANNFAVNESGSYSSFIELSFMARRLMAPEEVLVEHELPLPELDHPSVDWNRDVKPVFA